MAKADPTGLRRRIAAYLHEHGPTWGDRAIADLGLTPEKWIAAVGRCPWFAWPGAGRAGWSLTERGRAEGLRREGT